jgi:hypothetical protein
MTHTVQKGVVSRLLYNPHCRNYMSRLKKLYIKGRLIDLPHPFEEDVERLVRANHELLCKSISRVEQEQLSEAAKAEDPYEAGAEIEYLRASADELRREARSLALVSLVTRFQHWLRVFAEELTNCPAATSGVVKNMQTLKKELGEGPVPAAFFEDLETVRDSIIHADSNVEWMRGKEQRHVPLKYREVNLESLKKLDLPEQSLQEIRESAMSRINLTEQHLQEAMTKAIEQVKWYEDRLAQLEMSRNS